MVAETLFVLVSQIVFLMILILLVLLLVLRIRTRRREETLIRQWCDRKGYAINRIQATNASIFATMIFWLAGWLIWWVAYKRGWRLEIYDSECGAKTLVLRVNRRGQVEETWGDRRHSSLP